MTAPTPTLMLTTAPTIALPAALTAAAAITAAASLTAAAALTAAAGLLTTTLPPFLYSTAVTFAFVLSFAFVAACGWQERVYSTTDPLDCANAFVLLIPLALLSSLLVLALELEPCRVGFVLDPLLLA